MTAPTNLKQAKTWVSAYDPAQPNALNELRCGKSKAATEAAKLRALVEVGGAEALKRIATYRKCKPGPYGETFPSALEKEVVHAWAVWPEPEAIVDAFFHGQREVRLSGKWPLKRIEGLRTLKRLHVLEARLDKGCDLAALADHPTLSTLRLKVDLGVASFSPLARLPRLERLELINAAPIQEARWRELCGLKGLRFLGVSLGAQVPFDVLLGYPRLERLALAADRTALADSDLGVVRALLDAGVSVQVYTHEKWTDALRGLADTNEVEQFGYLGLSRREDVPTLQRSVNYGAFLGGVAAASVVPVGLPPVAGGPARRR